jgi:hypothetical protein
VQQLRREKLRDPRVRRLFAVAFTAAVGTLVVYWGAKVAGREAAHDAARTLQRQDAQSCSRNQIQRTYDRVDEAYGAPLANAVEGVVGKAGLPIYLTRRDERCFMNLVISGYFVRQAPRTDPGFLRHVCDASGNAYH